jgi:dTDP-4-dehydrorhamnose reductase
VECTVNRVGDQYFDQLERNGHAKRVEDLDLFASLGIRTLRYPVLWERTAPEGLEKADWAWADERLAYLRQLGIRPIVGLVHHGSGPRDTSLVDPAFPEKLAEYARAVAQRFPWITHYTPVNEPLTTARFSGLYGHWYPHGRDALTFARALIIQCRAIVLAMRAIREINPAAQLIQTEDLGKTFSTRALRYQAEFENERRWLTYDLLCGRVHRAHPMWDYLRWTGIGAAELEWFAANPCPPDILGVNYYVTSERFLDEKLERYPSCTHGGNGHDRYADVEAVRVVAEGCDGPHFLLQEAWKRYGLPLAVTEAHLACTREEQLRWFKEMWDAAESARVAGADIRAVTAWALLGSFDWNSLLTRVADYYEPGVFDLRSPRPRPTALAGLIRKLGRGEQTDHPAFDAPGWWQRLDRLIYFPEETRLPEITRSSGRLARNNQRMNLPEGKQRVLLITGATGTLGNAFARACQARAIPFRMLTRAEMDIAEPGSVQAAFDELAPWAVVNAAGYVRVDEAERNSEICRRENADGAAFLAAACAERGVALVTFSSDLVFDGSAQRPYVESDRPAPLNVYGQSKAEAESRVLKAFPAALVVRTSAFFGPWDSHNFLTILLDTLASGSRFAAASDLVVSPTYIPDLVDASLDLLFDGEGGIWHLANQGSLSWADLAQRVARLAGLDVSLVDARPAASLALAAKRPAYVPLGSERGVLLPSLENALSRYLHERGLSAHHARQSTPPCQLQFD